VNVDRRRRGTSVVRVRILAAGLALLGAGCAILGWGSRSRGVISSAGEGSLTFGGQPEVGTSLLTAPVEPKAELQSQARSLFAGLPLMFEPNEGQGNLDPADPRAKFVSRGSGYSLFLGSDGAILSMVSKKSSRGKRGASDSEFRIDSIEMKLAGANPKVSLAGMDLLPGRSHYFLGNDPRKWRPNVPQFARVRYENIYPGINLVFYGSQGHLEYDFQVAPGADPAQTELEFDGAKRLGLQNGALVIESEGGTVSLNAPIIYQEIAGKREPVEGKFVLRGTNRAGFAIGSYDRSRELIIDPILTFSTFFGGSLDETATSVAVDSEFSIYLTGSTTSLDLPVPAGALQSTLNGSGPNIYIAKITPPLGSLPAVLADATYLGGTGSDTPVGIKVDGANTPYVAGTTSSTDFPVTPTNAYQSSPTAGSPGPHAFVTKIKSDFSGLLYSSYLSGNGSDTASGMTIDPSGNVYVTGTTTSNNVANAATGTQFPASTLPDLIAFQQISNAAIQFFVTKVNTNASGYGSISYSTYFGGANFTAPPPIATTGACGGAGQNPQNLPCVVGGGIAVDANNNVYFTGSTNFTHTGCTGCGATDFPILDAYQACLDQPSPSSIVNPPPCSYTSTPYLPDAFVAKLNPNGAQGQQLLWSTYVGGSQAESGAGVALDSGAANVYLVGTTNSGDFVNSAAVKEYASFQSCLDNLQANCNSTAIGLPNDAFVARLSNPANTTGAVTNVSLNYFSYLGGQNDEEGTAVAVDSNSGAMVTGSTTSPSIVQSGNTLAPGSFPVFPYPNSLQSQLNGTRNAFVARINTAATVTGNSNTASWASFLGGNSVDVGTGITLDVNQNSYVAGETNSTTFPIAKPLQDCLDTPVNPSPFPPCPGLSSPPPTDAFVTQLGTAVSLSITGQLTLGTNQTYVSAGNPATFTYTLTNNGPDLASNIEVIDNLSPAFTGGITFTNVSATISSGTCSAGSSGSGISCGPVSLPSGSTATVTITATPTIPTGGSSPEPFNGGTVQAIAPGNVVLAETSVPGEMSDYSMLVSPENFSVPAAGFPATYNVQLTPHPIYGSTVTLSCSNLPAGTACNWAPGSSTTLQSTSGATVTLTITTTVRPIIPTASLFTRRFYAVWFTLPGLALLGIGSSRRRRRVFGVLTFWALLSLVLFLPSCSHTTTQTPQTGTPAGNWGPIVTATSGSDSKSQTIGLSVP